MCIFRLFLRSSIVEVQCYIYIKMELSERQYQSLHTTKKEKTQASPISLQFYLYFLYCSCIVQSLDFYSRYFIYTPLYVCRIFKFNY